MARFIKLKEAAKSQTSEQANGRKPRVKRKTNENEDTPGAFDFKSQHIFADWCLFLIFHSIENHPKKPKKALSKKLKKDDARNDKEYENLYQRPNESNRSFMRRVNRITEESVEEAKFEAKYGVEVHRDKKTGEIKLKKRPTNEIDERLKQNAINAKRNGKNAAAAVVIPADERKKLAKAMFQERKKQKQDELLKVSTLDEFKRDEIKFGEVVLAPPQLTAPRLAKKAETVPRVRMRTFLLERQ